MLPRLGALFHELDDDTDQLELDMKMILSACPANVLTLPLIEWFCSPRFDGLRSRDKHAYKADLDHITSIFEKMQEFKLGRVLRHGREIMFQKNMLKL